MIKILSEDTIQKIAAGEVVERPASIIKELVENSIDADADEISVQIRNGGKTFLKVVDNGDGIAEEDVELAFSRHATSKITEFDDLYKIHSMGFRGEALASIVAVSKLDIYTKTANQSTGIHLSYDNNKLLSKKPVGMNKGTSIEVRDLFEYIPVRKKFLQSDMVESNKITAMMYSFAIGNVGKTISYSRDDKLIFSTNKNNSLKENLTILFGRDYTKNLIELNQTSDEYKVYGFASNNNFFKGNRAMQYVFVNGRYIDNAELVNNIESQYNAFIPNGRYPAFQLFIETNPKNIDINISPNKQKIKFSFQEELIDLVKDSFNKSLSSSMQPKSIGGKLQEGIKPNFYDLNGSDKLKEVLDQINPPKISTLENKPEVIEKPKNPEYIIDDEFELISIGDDEEDQFKEIVKEDSNYYQENLNIHDIEKSTDSVTENGKLENFDAIFKSIIFNKYMVFEIKLDELLIIDVNRAKERLTYDSLTKELNTSLNTTKLLSPIILDLNPQDIEIIDDYNEEFINLGFEIDQFGKNSIAIRQVPYINDKPANKEFFLELLDNINDKNNFMSLVEIYKKKASIIGSKTRTNISEQEALLIYENLKNSSNMHVTEYGKKISYTLTVGEFERILLR